MVEFLSTEAPMLVIGPLVPGSQLKFLLTKPMAATLPGFTSPTITRRALSGFPQLEHWSNEIVVENAGVDTASMDSIRTNR